MRPLLIAASALAVFFLAITLLVTRAEPAPAVPAADHCVLCHPRAHTDGWMQSHATEIADSDVSAATCTDCHDTAYCDDCHASVPGFSAGMGSSGGSAGTGTP